MAWHGLRRSKILSVVTTLGLILSTVPALIPSVSLAAEPEVKPLQVLLVLGGCCHDYDAQKDLLKKGLEARAHVEVSIAYDPDTTTRHLNPVYENPEWAKGFDVVIHNECTADVSDLDVINRILDPHRDGLPAVILHCGMHSYRSEGFPKETPWFDFTGLATTGHGPQLPIDLVYHDASNPITQGLADWRTMNEELYNNSNGALHTTAKSITTGFQAVKNSEGATVVHEAVVAWTNDYNGKTRVFGTTLGHNNVTVEDPNYLDLVTRGLLWSCDKLNDTYLKSPEAK